MQVYLDNSATTRPSEEVIEAMNASMRDMYYNPSALYAPAVEVERRIRKARDLISMPIHLGEMNVTFTSGGTEADNLAIVGRMMGQRKEGVILYSAAEHPAVKNACLEVAARYGHIAKEIPLTDRGSLDMNKMEKLVDTRVKLICVMQVCNETGIIMPMKRVVAMRDRLAPEAAIHVDGVQGFMRVPFSMIQLRIQSYALSAHKIQGPKGIGALVCADDYRLRPQVVGGGQQKNRRSGTENVEGIVGLRTAVEALMDPIAVETKLRGFRNQMITELSREIPEMRVNGGQINDSDAAPHILSIALPPVRSETMVHALSEVGVYVGTGSACSSHSKKRSEVLTAIGIAPELIDSTIRISFAMSNTREEIEFATKKIVEKYKLLARYKRR